MLYFETKVFTDFIFVSPFQSKGQNLSTLFYKLIHYSFSVKYKKISHQI